MSFTCIRWVLNISETLLQKKINKLFLIIVLFTTIYRTCNMHSDHNSTFIFTLRLPSIRFIFSSHSYLSWEMKITKRTRHLASVDDLHTKHTTKNSSFQDVIYRSSHVLQHCKELSCMKMYMQHPKVITFSTLTRNKITNFWIDYIQYIRIHSYYVLISC